MKWILLPPTIDDLIRILKAWRFWVIGTLLGAGLSWLIYVMIPPPYLARATVNVDFNLEEAWPEETDRQQFYYLEREVRKLEEVAWSDGVMEEVSSLTDSSISDLREQVLALSQPAEAGWHFYAKDRDPETAAKLASTWAEAFVKAARLEIASQSGLNMFIRVETTQVMEVPLSRSVPLWTYLLSGSASVLIVMVGFLLFMKPNQPS